MKPILLVFLGGGIGSVLRFLISKTFNSYIQHFYLGTFLVNIIGCLLIGLFLGLSMKGNTLSNPLLLLLATGFCGGFTTFSAFAYEKYELLHSGAVFYFLLYLFSSIFIGLVAVGLGIWIAKFI